MHSDNEGNPQTTCLLGQAGFLQLACLSESLREVSFLSSSPVFLILKLLLREIDGGKGGGGSSIVIKQFVITC